MTCFSKKKFFRIHCVKYIVFVHVKSDFEQFTIIILLGRILCIRPLVIFAFTPTVLKKYKSAISIEYRSVTYLYDERKRGKRKVLDIIFVFKYIERSNTEFIQK
jgi:hypothetical protein